MYRSTKKKNAKRNCKFCSPTYFHAVSEKNGFFMCKNVRSNRIFCLLRLLPSAHWHTTTSYFVYDCQDIDFHTLQNIDTIHDTELTLYVLVTNFPNVIIYARHAIALANFEVTKCKEGEKFIAVLIFGFG